MIIGIGCDVVKISRVKQAVLTHGDRFLSRIYTPYELRHMPSGAGRYGFLAKRFAAKEALAKALGTGIGQAVSFLDIEVHNNTTGAPLLRVLHGKAADLLAGAVPHLSLTDDGGVALAYVVVERGYTKCRK